MNLDSPLEVLRATFNDKGLYRLEFLGAGPEPPRPVGKMARQLAKELAAYFRGKQKTFVTPLDLSCGTEFQQKVWKELLRIPFGATISYGELARRVGSPGGARAVGQAVGANPVPIVVPCHRVIRESGALGGYSAGLDIKRWLLRHEGVIRDA